MRTVAALDERLAEAPDDDFAARRDRARRLGAAAISPRRSTPTGARDAARRARDRRPAPPGSRRHSPRQALPAARSSTGEQKALLLGLVLAHAELVAERRGEPPILLLDEVAAHLDPKRRAALFARLEGRGQVWMTATEAALVRGDRRLRRASTSSRAIAHPE